MAATTPAATAASRLLAFAMVITAATEGDLIVLVARWLSIAKLYKASVILDRLVD